MVLMLRNLFTDDDGTWGNRNVSLQKDGENTMDETCQQQGRFFLKKDENKNLKTETHRAYWSQKDYIKMWGNVTNKFVQMDVETDV